ncbi:MAG: hypothetical protein J6T41_06970, partial [Neisseriaceae bacterium]|nr:hypothetical protein [Neisseriaceae bacterium]
MNAINFMSLLNGSSHILLLLFFLLLARQNIWAWVAGGSSAVIECGFVIFTAFKYPNMASTSLSGIYGLMINLSLCLYDAWVWHQNGHRFFHQPKEQYYPVSSLLKEPYSKQKYMILGAVLSVLLLISILIKQGVFNYLYIIVYTLAFILIADKKIEAWILLIISVVLLKLSMMWQLHALSHNTSDSIKMLSVLLQNIKNGDIWLKLIIFVYGFIYWKSKLNKEEKIEFVPLSSLLKTGLLSLIYIIATFATPFLLTYLACMGSTGCSGIPAGLFLMLFYFVSFIIAA